MARLPIVIIPGFCSTRLEVESSDVCPSWKGQKIWLGLTNIGFSAMHGKGTWADKESLSLKNQWLQHLVLASPERETEGVRLTAVPGLAGVKSLDPDSFMGLAAEMSYVFSPVISYLETLGYVEGEDLVAASYDWRFAPSVLEKRGYFSQLIQTIEALKGRCQKGVVLLAHSMGNKVVSYFLNFAKHSKGMPWLDEHIHLWIAAGAPHAGAPQALRSTIFGDKFGLDGFVTDSEARAFARSLSAAPWLFPIGPEASAVFHLRRGGALEIKQLCATVEKCGISVNNKVMITLEVCWGRKTENLTTKSASSFDGRSAKFEEVDNFLQFAGPEEMPAEATIKAIVKEKGISNGKDSWLSRMGQGLSAGVMLVEEAAMGRKGLGVPKASLLSSKADGDGFVEVRLPISKLAAGPISALGYAKSLDAGDVVVFRMRWLNFTALKKTWAKSDSLWTGAASTYHFSCQGKAQYEPIGVEQVLRIEGCEGIGDTWKTYYRDDPLYDDRCSGKPPVRRMRAVHGVNVPTEIAFALRVQSVRLKQSKILTRLVLDDEAEMGKVEGCSLSGGVVRRTGTSHSLSGDGVVDLQSLDECRRWARDGLACELTYLPGVEHRAMLADAHFHQTIKDAVLSVEMESSEASNSLSIAGTFSNWKPMQMMWDGCGFVYVVSIGPNGWESFQLLLDGSWDKVFYPDPGSPHSILGPDNKNAGKDWTIGKNRGKLLDGSLRTGSAYKVKVEMSGKTPRSVTWEPFSQVQVLHGKGIWQFQHEQWQNLPEELNQQLNSAIALEQNSVDVEINQQVYRMDLLNMSYSNMANKQQGRIHRI